MNKLTKVSIGISTALGTALSTVGQVFAQSEPGEIGVEVPEDFFFQDAGALLSTLLRTVMIIAGLLVFAYLVWGGIEWITSGGDSSKTEAARNKITAAIVGLIILAAAYALFQLLLNLLGVSGFGQIFNGTE